MPPLYVPVRTGLEALFEVGSVRWSELRHAFGIGVAGPELYQDVARSLRELARDLAKAYDGLTLNIYHQGTVYEATAYAVPFLAAVAAGDVDSAMRLHLVQLLAEIALGASGPPPDGAHSGALGDGVAASIRDAFSCCEQYLRAIADRDSTFGPLVSAIEALAAAPGRATYAAVLCALGDGDRPNPFDSPDGASDEC